MWTLSAVLIAVGIAGDIENWWSDLPFLSNLSSSAAGALFGIPLAIVFFQRIIHAEDESRERRDMLRLAQRSAGDLLAEVVQLFPDWPGLKGFRDVEVHLSAAQKAFQVSSSAFYGRKVNDEEIGKQVQDTLVDSFEKGFRSFSLSCNGFDQISLGEPTISQVAEKITIQLSFLRDYVLLG
jgi:hypothetical protein